MFYETQVHPNPFWEVTDTVNKTSKWIYNPCAKKKKKKETADMG